MKNLLVKSMVGIFVCSMMTLAFSANSNAGDKRITFGGGPAGGTFQVVANAIQVYQPVKDIEGISVKAQTSAGSVENLRKTNPFIKVILPMTFKRTASFALLVKNSHTKKHIKQGAKQDLSLMSVFMSFKPAVHVHSRHNAQNQKTTGKLITT